MKKEEEEERGKKKDGDGRIAVMLEPTCAMKMTVSSLTVRRWLLSSSL